MSPRRNVGLDVDRRPTAMILKAILGYGWSYTAFGVVPLPGSLAAGPQFFGQLAAIVVFGGCVVSIIGLIYGYLVDLFDGLAVEAFGLVGLGLGAAMYAYALTGVADVEQARPACFTSLAIAGYASVQYVLIFLHRRRDPREKAKPHPTGAPDGG